MKKMFLLVFLAAGMSVAVNAQTQPKKEDNKMDNMNTKKHVCTKACKDGKHVYAHGEKGHVCTAACMKKM
jgi:hypothetical protein